MVGEDVQAMGISPCLSPAEMVLPCQAAMIHRYVRKNKWLCLKFYIQSPAISPGQSLSWVQGVLPFDTQCSLLASTPGLPQARGKESSTMVGKSRGS